MARHNRRGVRGVAFVDFHGDSVDRILHIIPKRRINDIVYLNFSDRNYVPMLNYFFTDGDVGKAASDSTDCFKGLFETWGPRMENIIRNVSTILSTVRGLNVCDVGTLISKDNKGDKFRALVVPLLQNNEAKRFWKVNFQSYTNKDLDSVTNKLGKLLEDKISERFFSVRENRFNHRKIIDESKIWLENLSSGILGSATADTMGTFSVAKFHQAAISRAELPPEQRTPFYLYTDETARLSTSFFADIIEEDRKFGLFLTLAFQREKQLTEATREALSGIGSIIAFNVGADDARSLFKTFKKEVEDKEFLNLEKYEAFALIENQIVSIKTLPPVKTDYDYSSEITELSRKKYCMPVSDFKPEDVFSFLTRKGIIKPIEISQKRREYDTF